MSELSRRRDGVPMVLRPPQWDANVRSSSETNRAATVRERRRRSNLASIRFGGTESRSQRVFDAAGKRTGSLTAHLITGMDCAPGSVRKYALFLAALALLTLTLSAASDLVPVLKRLALSNHFETARELLEDRRSGSNQQTSSWFAAVSWVARAAERTANWEAAHAYGREALEGSQELLQGASPDSDPHLPTALGASIEVLGRAQAANGDRSGAVQFLQDQREAYRGSSIETRIQKNLLMLSLEGKALPAVDMSRFISEAKTSTANLHGKVTLFYFWAHWCSDCKRQRPVLEKLQAEFGKRGLRIVGPTRLYGYVEGGSDAPPADEVAYITGRYQDHNPTPKWMPVPLSNENFVNFGVSSTPTLVIVDRGGIVRLYHPGHAPYEKLASTIEPLLAPDNG